MRIVAVIVFLAVVFGGIGSIFWYQEMQYLLPTPVPKEYRVVAPSEIVRFDSTLIPQRYAKPKLFHFFSPDCPCSRFNLKHFHSLSKKYGRMIDFFVVIPNEQRLSSAKYMVDKNIPIILDTDGRLAKACGVYSTPQAALIRTDNTLYFRGNYNRSRWCVDKNSNFVQMAMDSLLINRKPPTFIELATQSYGCSITREQEASVIP
jgi:hypothetical protein